MPILRHPPPVLVAIGKYLVERRENQIASCWKTTTRVVLLHPPGLCVRNSVQKHGGRLPGRSSAGKER
jgi:hypothetical protein